MSASSHFAPDELPVAQERLVNLICNAFEADWKAGESPSIEDQLGRIGADGRTVLLRELILIELFYRPAGPETFESYRSRFPDLDPAWLTAALQPSHTFETPHADHKTPTDLGQLSPVKRKNALAGRRIGDYELLEELGRGGMGVIYRARQTSLNRLVALKFILAGDLASENARQRFQIEAEAAAGLDHPNILPVYDFGEHDGNRFLAMKLVETGSLAQHLSEIALTARALDRAAQQRIARLLSTVARAVHHAHQRGILHRDLKPGNVLLDENGEPLVTDFGLARRIGASARITESNALIGTPAYLAPEMITDRGKNVSVAADVYALGVLLYELLTGIPPFQSSTGLEILRQVVEDEPPPPRRLQPHIDRDLEIICLKCLRKEPQARYSSAEDVAEDLERFQRREPITARPVGRLERGVKWVKRRPVTAGLIAVVLLVTLAGLVGISLAYGLAVKRAKELSQEKANVIWEKDRADDEAEKARLKAAEAERERGEKESQLRRAQAFLMTARMRRVATVRDRDPLEAFRLLHDCEACPIHLRDEAWRLHARSCVRDRVMLVGHRGPVMAVAFSPDGATVASVAAAPQSEHGSNDSGEIKLWDVAGSGLKTTLHGHFGHVLSLAFSPDGKSLVSAGQDKTVIRWSVATGRPIQTLEGHTGPVQTVAFSPDGNTLASGGTDQTVILWDVAAGTRRATLQGHGGHVQCVVFDFDGKTLAAGVGGYDAKLRPKAVGGIKLWDVKTGQPRATLQAPTNYNVQSVAFSPDGATLVAATSHFDAGSRRHSGGLRTWDVATAQERAGFQQSYTSYRSVRFAGDGRTLVTASSDGAVKLWDSATRQLRDTLVGHNGIAQSAAFSPDGRIVASAASDGTVMLWDVTEGQRRVTFKGHTNPIYAAAASRDGKHLVCAGIDQRLSLWDVPARRLRARFQVHANQLMAAAFAPDGKVVATASLDRTAKLWDVATGRLRTTLQGHAEAVLAVAVSEDGATVATGSGDKTIRLWDAATGQMRATLRGHGQPIFAVAFGPGGKTLASAAVDGTILLWDMATKQVRATLRGHGSIVWCLAFSADGKTLASSSVDRTVILWDAAAGEPQSVLRGHANVVKSVSFSPDGKTLASGGTDGTIKLWNLATGQERATLISGMKPVVFVELSRDGNTLISASADAMVTLWDLTKVQPHATLLGHSDLVQSVAYSADGKVLRSTDRSQKRVHWDLSTGQQVPARPGLTFLPDSLDSPDGNVRAKLMGAGIYLLDRSVPDEHATWSRHYALNRAQAGHWHKQQAEKAKREGQVLAAAFHLSKAADHSPWDAGSRAKEADAWRKANQPDRAAVAEVHRAILLANPWVGLLSSK